MSNDALYRPKSESTDVVFFGTEARFDVPEVFWMSQNKGKLDFLELFAGKAVLSYCASQAGLSTGSPIDINTGYDLNTYEGQQKAWKIIKDGRPEVVYMAHGLIFKTSMTKTWFSRKGSRSCQWSVFVSMLPSIKLEQDASSL